MGGIATLDQLLGLLRAEGIRTAWVKLLSEKQDNEKNQIYLGGGLDGVTNLFPARIEVRSASESLTKRKSAAGKPKLEAVIDFAWLGGAPSKQMHLLPIWLRAGRAGACPVPASQPVRFAASIRRRR